MIRALFLSIGQLGDAAVLRVFVKSMAVTLAVFAVLGGGVWWATQRALAASVQDYSGALATMFALFVTILALWLLFRAVAIAVVSLFADAIVAAVEAKHYPQALRTAKPVAFARAMRMGLGSAARVVLVNALMLPVYIALLVTGVGTAAAFFVVNGWLLGRDLEDMVAARHMDAAAMRAFRKTNGPRRFVLGLANTGLFVVPVVNIAAPVLGAAMATHVFHARRSLRM